MSEKGTKKVRAKAPRKKAAKPKKKAKMAEQTEEEKRETPTPPARVDLGEHPLPTVESRHKFSMESRQGRGFSFGEIQSAGIPRVDVAKHRIPLDIRRRTTLDQNVQSLRNWFGQAARPSAEHAAKPAAKRKKSAA